MEFLPHPLPSNFFPQHTCNYSRFITYLILVWLVSTFRVSQLSDSCLFFHMNFRIVCSVQFFFFKSWFCFYWEHVQSYKLTWGELILYDVGSSWPIPLFVFPFVQVLFVPFRRVLVILSYRSWAFLATFYGRLLIIPTYPCFLSKRMVIFLKSYIIINQNSKPPLELGVDR